MKLENDHNVYILGAGFSADAGMPLVSDFLLQMRDSHSWLEQNGRKAEAVAVNKVLEFRLDAASAAYWVTLDLENIEELFSLASASRGKMDEHIKLAIAATLDYARTLKGNQRKAFHINGKTALFQDAQNEADLKHPAWAKHTGLFPGRTVSPHQAGPYEMDLYGYYAARLLGMFHNGKPCGQNTFITFNYDTILENALRTLGIPYCYGFKPNTVNFAPGAEQEVDDSTMRLLKLHGSVNWAYRPGRGRSFTVYPGYEDVQQQNLAPELVPPTWKKVFENQLAAVWEAAVESLNTATRVVIIGFSMPPTDMHFKYLMAAGLQKNVSLREIVFVNPNGKELENRARQLLRDTYIDSKRITFQGSYLNAFMAHMQPLDLLGRGCEYGVAISG